MHKIEWGEIRLEKAGWVQGMQERRDVGGQARTCKTDLGWGWPSRGGPAPSPLSPAFFLSLCPHLSKEGTGAAVRTDPW